MIDVTVSPLHHPDARITIEFDTGNNFYELEMRRTKENMFERGIRVYLSRDQVIAMRDQLNALLPIDGATLGQIRVCKKCGGFGLYRWEDKPRNPEKKADADVQFGLCPVCEGSGQGVSA